MKFSTLFILLACVSGAFGQPNSSFYVATTGVDSNPGTQAAPWRTIQHAADTARAGSTVNVRGGSYEELVSINASGNASDGFITLRSYPGERQRSWRQSISLLMTEAASLAFTTRVMCESRVLRFATSAPPNIGSLRWA